MTETQRNTIVGVFVMAGLLSLAALVVLFGQRSLLPATDDAYFIHVHFNNASGIRDGSLATIGGVTVGRVEPGGVRFVNPDDYSQGVRVTIRFDSGLVLREGASASTVEPGLGMGRPPIVIFPGNPDAPPLVSGAAIRGTMSSMVESIIPPSVISLFENTAPQLGDSAAALRPVLEDLHELLQPRGVAAVDTEGGPPGNLSSAAARLDSTLKHMNTVLGDEDSQSQLRATIENLHKMSEDGRQLATDLKAAAAEAKQVMTDARGLVASGQNSLTQLDGNIDRITRSFVADLELASQLLTQLNETAAAMNRPEGTVGRLMKDPRLYEEATLTFRRLAEAVEEMRALVRDVRDGKVHIRVGL